MATSLTRIEGGFITVALTAAAAPAFTRLSQQTSGLYQAAGLTERGDCVLDHDALASDPAARAKLVSSAGTLQGIASGAIATAGLTLYSAANGTVSTTQGTNAVVVGKSKSSAADGGVVEYHHRAVL